MKKVVLFLAVLMMLFLAGCSDAEIASHNLSKQADMFQVTRR
jgi:outer membrane lipoprotein SlyB